MDMLYLESFVHRVRLAEIVSRWMVNQSRPDDVRNLKEIINFNSYISRIWVDRLAKDLFFRLHGKEPQSFIAKTKGQLKDFVVNNPLSLTPRVEELVARYRRFPEDFYRETPFDGRVYFHPETDHPHFIGSMRIKRFRRIAEKGSRRIVDFMFDRIRASADDLAQERAARLGIPKSQLITPPEEMAEEFRHAERRLIKRIKQGTIQSEFPILSIPDVVGLKLIAEPNMYLPLLDVIKSNPSCVLLEEEHHVGKYNATNLRVAHIIPKELLLSCAPEEEAQRIFVHRGFEPGPIVEQYKEFIRTAEDHVLLEIIVCDFEEFIESEIGRSMHEDRILAQRSFTEYQSHLATNVRYLMDYILLLCLAPGRYELNDVPIKLWVKYMPDTIERMNRALFEMPMDSSFDFASPRTAKSMQDISFSGTSIPY